MSMVIWAKKCCINFESNGLCLKAAHFSMAVCCHIKLLNISMQKTVSVVVYVKYIYGLSKRIYIYIKKYQKHGKLSGEIIKPAGIIFEIKTSQL